jgi:hypothetical protein
MNTQTGCQGRECTVQATLPLLGPLLALGGMLVIAASTAVMTMI